MTFIKKCRTKNLKSGEQVLSQATKPWNFFASRPDLQKIYMSMYVLETEFSINKSAEE